jgi:hypothetical protein
VIFDIVEYIIMEWTMPNRSQICRIFKIICRTLFWISTLFCAYPIKKEKSVADLFSAVEHNSETYCWTQKLNRQASDYGVTSTFFLKAG